MLFTRIFFLSAAATASALGVASSLVTPVDTTALAPPPPASTSSIPETIGGHPNVASIDPSCPFTETPVFTIEQLYNLSTRFFDTFMYPKNAAEAAKINSTLFAENVQGRVDATRNFIGRELNTEYAFGLFSDIALNPKSFTLLGVPQAYKLTKMTGNGNIASLSITVDFNITALNVVNPVEIIFDATYNSLGEISQYDATFRWLQWQFDALAAHAQQQFNLSSLADVTTLSTNLLAGSICDTAEAHCTGDNQQYTSKNECLDFLKNDVRFGQAYELGMNTLTCRMVHQGMVVYRPGVHCAHIGRGGGGYCTDDRTYAGNVVENLFTNSPFVAYGAM